MVKRPDFFEAPVVWAGRGSEGRLSCNSIAHARRALKAPSCLAWLQQPIQTVPSEPREGQDATAA
jgi:hypothetical protein